jgi:hypothetical protein
VVNVPPPKSRIRTSATIVLAIIATIALFESGVESQGLDQRFASIGVAVLAAGGSVTTARRRSGLVRFYLIAAGVLVVRIAIHSML